MVREMALADDVMMLRVAAKRAAEAKDLEAQRTLMLKCEKVKSSLSTQLESLKAQQKELLALMQTVDSVTRSGKGVYSSDFEATLAKLNRDLQ